MLKYWDELKDSFWINSILLEMSELNNLVNIKKRVFKNIFSGTFQL